MSKFTAKVVQKLQSQLLNQVSKTAFSQKTAKFVFIALLTFAIALTSFAAQATPQKALTDASSSPATQTGIFPIQPNGRDRHQVVSELTRDRNPSIFYPAWQP